MSSSHASKGGRRWRYYVSRAALTGRKQDAGSIVRVPASEIEHRITRAVGTHLAVQAAIAIDDHHINHSVLGANQAIRAAVALHFAHYNLVRLHRTLRTTPAMAANVSSRLWSLEELVERTSS